LYKISKYAYQEAFFDGQMQSMGSNQARFMERLNKDNNYMRNVSRMMKIFTSIYCAIVGLFPVIGFIEIKLALQNGVDPIWAVFSGSLVFSMFFAVQLTILVLFGVLFASGLMSGGSFRWLTTLPLGKGDMEKVSLFTLFRGVDLQLIILTLVFPVVTAIITQNPLLVGISIIIAVSNAIFSLSILVILGRKMFIIMERNDESNPKTSLIRILTMLTYVIGSILFFVLIQSVWRVLVNFIRVPFLSIQMTEVFSLVLSFIPFPFAGGFLVTLLTANTPSVSPFVWIGSIIGLGLSLLFTYAMYKKALGSLHNIAFSEVKTSQPTQKKTLLEDVKIKTVSPVRAFIKKDLSIATRDIQVMMAFIFPFLMPLVMFISISASSPDVAVSFANSGFNMSFMAMAAIVIIAGFSNMENTGASIISSLPILVRDQVSAKIRYLMVILPLATLSSLIFALFQGNPGVFIEALINTLFLLPVTAIAGIAGFLVKIRLFGKLKYKYVLEDFHNNNKIVKWIIVSTVVFMITLGAVILTSVTTELFGFLGYAVILTLEIGLSIVLLLIFNRMFPKPNLRHKFNETEGKDYTQQNLATT
ncbi:MAG: hypothetical protein ACFFCZ_26650, partial [Promethearchaeota archaeon]